MARCVLIVDSATGKVIDVAGNVREGGRYRKFVGRMMSADANPVLDYGVNGGNKLEISRGGYAGEEVKIKAATVKVSGDMEVAGDLKVAGVSISDIAGCDLSALVSKEELAEAIEGLSVSEDATLEDVKSTLSALLENLAALVATGNTQTLQE